MHLPGVLATSLFILPSWIPLASGYPPYLVGAINLGCIVDMYVHLSISQSACMLQCVQRLTTLEHDNLFLRRVQMALA